MGTRALAGPVSASGSCCAGVGGVVTQVTRNRPSLEMSSPDSQCSAANGPRVIGSVRSTLTALFANTAWLLPSTKAFQSVQLV